MTYALQWFLAFASIVSLFLNERMNLFILSLIPREVAEAMMDKHIVKIILEAVQMLCSARRILLPDDEEGNAPLYKLAHKNHPVTIWCRESQANFIWTLDLVDEMHKEWQYRYEHPETKIHKSYTVAQYLREHMPDASLFPQQRLTPFAQAMPVQYKHEDAVQAYRNYYMSEEKQKIATWNKKRAAPSWYIKM
jgi:hypothetical protein